MHNEDNNEARGLDEIEIRQIASETMTDVRSVRKVVAGGVVRGIAGARIARAIQERRPRSSKARGDNEW